MNTKKYLVKLTPHNKFFFGGEKTFDSARGSNYMVKSNYFPQQTGILGLIRHQLLIQNQCMPLNRNRGKAKKLIGKHSFTIQNKPLDFGAIQKISPVFICRDKEFFFPANKEYQWDDEKKEFTFRKYTNTVKGNAYQNSAFIPFLEGYNAKDGLLDLLVNKDLSIKKYYDFDEENKEKPTNGIFIKEQQVGIRKNYDGETKDEAFYIQTFLRFNKDFCFAFIVELDLEYDEKNLNTKFESSNLVIFGGEKCTFHMNVTDINSSLSLEEYFESIAPIYPKSCADKLVLTSDAYVEENYLNQCQFAISETIPFRSLYTDVDVTTEWHGISYHQEAKEAKEVKEVIKSGRFNLLKKGSVLYGDKNMLKTVFDKNNFKKIGYNHYKLIEK